MHRLASGLAAACLTLVLALGLTTSATAAPVPGPAGEPFYTPPSPLPAGANGDLIWYRASTVNLGAGAPTVKAWDVLYRSTDSKGNANAVTGTVLVPTSGYGGTRPIVSYAWGTQGLGPQCAPSRALETKPNYETSNVVAALKKGWAVVSTDYAGYTNGAHPSYLAGKSEGNSVLDIVKAATQIPSVGLSYSARTALWGYSQGGQAVGFAGENKATYAPALNLVGVAAGGVPGDFIKTARLLNGSAGAAFLLGGVVGLATEYPAEIPFDEVANAAGKAARDEAWTECVFETLNKHINTDIASFTATGQSLEELMNLPTVRPVLEAQALGSKAVPVPVYQYHGQADEFIPLDQAIDLKKAWCAKGTRLKFDLYPSEHIVTQTQAGATGALSWLTTRIAAGAVPNTCSTTAPPPTSTADPAGGDFVVNLDKWALKGGVLLAKLKQNIALPSSFFTGSANMTTKQIDGIATISPFATTITLLGLPVKVSLLIQPIDRVRGTIELDDAGDVHMNASVPVNLRVQSFGAFGITFGAGCKTERPFTLPLSYDGTVGALGAGTFTSKSTASFPNLENCGLYAPLLSAIMSGPGQQFTLTEVPPLPKAY